MSDVATRKQRAAAHIIWDRVGAPDPLVHLAERWAAKASDKRIKPGSDSKRAKELEELAFRLMPYLHAKLKQTELDLTTAPEITVTIGGE